MVQANRVAPLLNLQPDTVPNRSDGFHALIMGACDFRRIGEAPLEPLRHANKNRTTFRAGSIANSDDMGKKLTAAGHVKNAFGLILRNVHSDFLHHFNHHGIERARLQSRAVALEKLWTNVIEERFRHLASGAVVDANE